MSDDHEKWSWEFTRKAHDDFAGLGSSAQNQIAKKLDEICASPYRDPPEYGEPLPNSPYRKIRIRRYHLSMSVDRDRYLLSVHRIKP